MFSKNLVLLSLDMVRKRQLHGLSQAAIAKHLRITIGTFSRWEAQNFAATKFSYVIKVIKYYEKKGIFFDEHLQSGLTHQTKTKTTRTVK